MTVERLRARFFAKTKLNEETGCIEWVGAMQTGGYGLMRDGERRRSAHTIAWELDCGPVPDGLELDHLCRNRRCVNVAHLEPVTHAENLARGVSPTAINATKTHCSNGHPFDETNTYWLRGRRQCRACNRQRVAEYQQRKRS